MKVFSQRFRLLGATSIVVMACSSPTSDAWTTSPGAKSNPTRLRYRQSSFSLYEKNDRGGFLDFLSPYESKIPVELRDDIYAAEANTPAAKDRGQRVALYILIAFCGIISAFFNGFLSEIRASGPDGTPGVDLVEAGFDWVVYNPILSFLFLNKIGGGISLLGGAGVGLLAEAELDTKRINAEKIYEEMERRRAAKSKPTKSKKGSSKKRRSGKESKRLEALSEVMEEKEITVEEGQSYESETIEEVAAEQAENEQQQAPKDDDKGFFGSIKSLYDKADTMAASQALLLNKKLEDVGVVEKITDESGLKVIGRDEASKTKKEKEEKTDKK